MAEGTATEIASLLGAPLSALGLVAVDTAVTTAGKTRVLRVLVDRDVTALDTADTTSRIAPLSLDEVADATRVVGDTLDGSDVMGDRPYTLEVSSPGVSRPLEGYAALRRNVGRLVTLSVDGYGDGGDLTGRVRAVSTAEVTVGVPAAKRTPARTHTVPLDQVRSGRVQVEFSRPEEEGVED